jgi:ParB-like chromosome segregation protein Spo0J
MENFETIEALDIPIVKLKPLRERTVSKRDFERIKASMIAAGLLEPLLVAPDGDYYLILDGVQRYRIMLEFGIETVPCIVRQEKDVFTPNRMVNHVSAVQENRMIRTSLEELDEETIAAALGISSLAHRLNTTLLSQLHADAATALDKGQITLACARELTYVKPERQAEILAAMAVHNDYTIAFARALILKTQPKLRMQKHRRASNPWDQSERKKGELLKRLQDTEQKHDFYSRLYRQYSVDLLKLVIYARSLVTNKQVRTHMDQHHPTVVERFLKIIAKAEA